MYAELMGNHKRYRIKSRYGNKIVCEGRIAFDSFVLNNKRDAIYYCGSSSVSADRYARTTDTSAEVGKTYYKRTGITSYTSQVPTSNPAAEHLYEKIA